ncbi:MAG TPA: M50 family metallopeptidase [Candidatus Acidoferrum sp.]|nr:M50 family metallopeptidase [Candidatus Acidoferrum sp.]
MLALIGAIAAIGLLIVVHEAGHYFVARWCKMRVDRFSIGFGPPIWKWRRGETDFTIGPIPFGGFVQIHGMTLAEEVGPDDTRSYPNRPAWQRFVTIFAGPGTNYLFAIVLAIGLFAITGVRTIRYTVASVNDGFDAVGKLERGDRILRLDDQPLYYTYRERDGDSISALVASSRGVPAKVTVLRKGRVVDVTVTPRFDEKEGAYRLGIALGFDVEKSEYGVGTVMAAALYYPVDKTRHIMAGLADIFAGRQEPEFKGPVGITEMIKKQIDVGLGSVIALLMMLNVYLGLFNLLPLPALDGGRLVFLGYEMATRRRPNPRVEATVHMVGIMALLLLMVMVTYKDIAGLISRR